MTGAGGVWVWVGLTWTERVRMVLDRYGDRLTDVSIFGWRINAAGTSVVPVSRAR